MKKAKLIFAIILSLSILGGNTSAGNYPDKDVKHIMPWGAGGGSDSVMRGFMKNMEGNLGRKIYTVNITGAKSGLGVTKLMSSKADGYTVGTVTYDGVITVPYFGLLSDYSLEKLDFIATVTVHPTVLVANTDSAYKSLADLIAAAKKDPGSIQISNVGMGGVWHLPVLDLEEKAGVTFDHVVFSSGSAEQKEALLKKETDIACMSLGAASPLLKAKKITVLGVMAGERLEAYKDLPTMKEQGYEVVWGSMRMIAVPKGVSKEIQTALSDAASKTANTSKWKEWLDKNGGGWTFMDKDQTNSYVKSLQDKVFPLLDALVAKGLLKKEK
jgi:tripartite-type tricarboxylate transporter receptor subunit TctC